VEFNLLYRWHPTMSVQDEQWTEGVFKEVFAGKPFDQITTEDFGRTMRDIQMRDSGKSPADWVFGGIQRDPGNEGRFTDDDLARILKNATSHPASAFKARGSPPVMQIIEIMGIRMARSWGVCSLNDFRRFLALKPYASFEEWNPDPEIANTARKLYGNIENLELYPGLQAEEAKPVVPGAGLCPPYTTSRAILADAIALTRGDRFYTADLTPWNLTAWGYQDCQRDTNNAGFGSMLGRLLLRTLPQHYTANSCFTWFALMTPEAMQDNLTKLGVAKSYAFEMPGQAHRPVVVGKFKPAQAILDDHTSFGSRFVERAKQIMQGSGYLLSLDDPTSHSEHSKLVKSALIENDQFLQRAEGFFYAKTKELIKKNSYTLSGNEGNCIDIVGEVLNLVPIYFVSSMITSIPVKGAEAPRASYMPREMMQMLRDIFSYIFHEPDPSKQMRAQHMATSHAQELLDHIKGNIRSNSGSGLFSVISSLFRSTGETETSEFLQKLSATEKPKDELANHVLSVALITGIELSQALVNIVDFYFQDANADHRLNLMKIAPVGGTSTDATLQAYVREAIRLAPSLQGVVRHAKTSYGAHGLSVAPAQPVYLDFTEANVDPENFPNPTQVEISRPVEGYLTLNHKVYGVLGQDFVHKAMAQVLRAVFSFKNIRRAPGAAGTLQRIVNTTHHGITTFQYLDNKKELGPWAKSMVLQYDP
jgi:cytochrome P450